MDNIKNVIDNVVSKLSVKKPELQQQIADIWKQCLSEKEIEHARLDQVKDGKLIVIIDTPTWAYQFKTKKIALLKEIQKQLPDIQNIVFKVGKVK